MSTAIDKIHEFDRFGSILGLDRMNVLLDKLGNPHEGLKVIHVAGTNGKGSVCKFLAEGLMACGYKVGLYTSPFIESFNERIQLAGEKISNEDLELFTGKVLAAVREMVEEGLDSPTEFEVVTAIAFLYFKEKGADITVLEVGLGGSGDSTNVISQPLACAIASVSYDHMDRLGNTLTEIAGDKAGIIKEGVPVISNVSSNEAAAVIARKAYEKSSRLYDISGIPVRTTKETTQGQTVDMELYGTEYRGVEISMEGKHQGENLKTALAIIEVLRKQGKIKVERSRLYTGLKKAVQPGRFEIIRGEPAIILDGAHNEAGAEALQETMKDLFHDKKVLLVTGILRDKQVERILDHLLKITRDVVATEPDNPRKLTKEELAQCIADRGIKVRAVIESEKCAELVRNSTDYDVVLVAGSLYLVGEIRRALRDGKEEKQDIALL
ncbi:MAG: bifunctional folylpolyglutamate synthase/dihydrofolate synthase [Clostridiales bacterium]|nr:bifunctional folylpolyglutamate synthase/dihydrofolate synthase [Clostridiales bacterium]